MEDVVLFEEGNLKITSNYLIVFGKRQRISDITSIESHFKKSSKFFPILLIIIGWLGAALTAGISLVLVVLGVVWLFLRKKNYYIEYQTITGSKSTIEHKNPDTLNRIFDALEKALDITHNLNYD
jgi:hypothetical protein